MKNLPLLVGALVLALSFTPSAFAAGYGAAGCGLGSLVFEGKTDIVSQVLAATTNGTGVQTFGITTGTSNCDASGLVLTQKETEVFAANNLDILAKEMATGEGEHLAALSGLMGCSTEQTATFASFTQENFEVIYADGTTGAGQMLAALNAAMTEHPVLSAACSS